METDGIAIIGLSGRFPGAPDVETYWQNLKAGKESITRFPFEELETPSGSDPAFDRKDYVCARGMLEDVDKFDARFFGYLPRDVELMDPQLRIFLEICWEAIENAGYDALRYPGAIGVFGGCFMNSYLLANLCADPAFLSEFVDTFQSDALKTELGNDKDYVATHAAFKLGLRGPAVTVQTACSTSLVAVAMACQSLETRQCDMALAGGVTIVLPQKRGYRYRKGSILSPQGTCRPFDENAAGTVFSNGAGVVMLKRLSDAIADCDTIYAVIRGYATNNDGNRKVNFTAPSVNGQADVIGRALSNARIDPRTIGYVETHGTATPVGDPIEIAGLTTAFRASTKDSGYCAIGSVKANIGHLDVAAGVAGLIKVALSLHEGVLPPLINFEKPNPAIDFSDSPFFVNTALREWPQAPWPRRAAISALGVGGTNAHLVLEQAPAAHSRPARQPAGEDELFVLSARTTTALDQMARNLATFVAARPDISLADVAFTLQAGRREFDCRRFVVARDAAELVRRLQGPGQPGETGTIAALRPQVVFMFPGQGSQYPGMGRELYQSEPIFRSVIDRCADALASDPESGIDLRSFLLWSGGTDAAADERMALEMAQTRIAQPTIFAVEIALAHLLVEWGIQPAALVGHSVGEFAAATLAGIFELEDAIRLVAARGRLMQAQTPGRMLAVRQAADDVAGSLPAGLAIAAVNAPGLTVVSGPTSQIDAYAAELTTRGVQSSPLKTSHAFHSAMMAPAVEPLVERVRRSVRNRPSIDICSTSLGRTATAEELCDPDYWGEQILRPVLFSDAVRAAAGNGRRVLLEVGPRQTLTTFTRQTLGAKGSIAIVPVQGQSGGEASDSAQLLGAIGRLWVAGVTPRWPSIRPKTRRRIALPTYPFERARYWVSPPRETGQAVNEPGRMQPATGIAPGALVTHASTSREHSPIGGTTDLGTLIQGQLTLMSQQLDALEAMQEGTLVRGDATDDAIGENERVPAEEE